MTYAPGHPDPGHKGGVANVVGDVASPDATEDVIVVGGVVPPDTSDDDNVVGVRVPAHDPLRVQACCQAIPVPGSYPTRGHQPLAG
jgi:hypothetical protein